MASCLRVVVTRRGVCALIDLRRAIGRGPARRSLPEEHAEEGADGPHGGAPQPNWQEDRAVPSAILKSDPPPQTAAAGTKRARGRRAWALSDGIAVMAYNLLFSSEFVSVSHEQHALLCYDAAA